MENAQNRYSTHFEAKFQNKSRQVARSCCLFDRTLKTLIYIHIRVKLLFSVCLGVLTSFGKNRQQKKFNLCCNTVAKLVEIKDGVARFTTL